MYTGLHVTYPVFLPNFSENLIFLTDFRKILTHQISWNFPVGAELFHADRRTGRHGEANSLFSQFWENV